MRGKLSHVGDSHQKGGQANIVEVQLGGLDQSLGDVGGEGPQAEGYVAGLQKRDPLPSRVDCEMPVSLPRLSRLSR